LNFLDKVSKTPEISNFMKIRPLGAELLNADGQTGKHDNFAEVPKNVRLLRTLMSLTLSQQYVAGAADIDPRPK
jgi:hypothetical protein